MSTGTVAAETYQTPFCMVPLPTLVYMRPETRSEFDRLDLEESVGPWAHCPIRTLLKNDGKQWEFRCRAKQLGRIGCGITVIFQWLEQRVVGGEA